uniref:Ankyrin repeat and protein kinase domain-containing protein 1-like n=1 Tax=Crassostrea virginica TaxID=6565 RepID=A0A8B8ABA9_CRAVI|nr:ankyrin repeat and protein kinase domain-containing protein 1-like [Crassostrea virginica]XP_022287199.1 ankyrin repeat and protein kinase domain-containing protein 1-like [Crassostrea virginica]
MDYMEDGLFDVISRGDVAGLKDYLQRGLDVSHAFRSTDRQERLGKTLLEVALEMKQPDIASLLVENKCNANLKYIVDVRDYGLFLREYKKRDKLKLTPIFPAVVHGDIKTIKILVRGGYDVSNYDDRGCTAIWHAVDLDNYEMVKILLSGRSSDLAVNAPDNAQLRPLHIAAMHGNNRIASLLIRGGAEVDATQIRGWTSLLLACRAGSESTAKLLLLNGADPNHVGKNGHTPLSTSLQFSESYSIAYMLLESGADVNLELLRRCKAEKFMNLLANPGLYHLLVFCSESPRTLRTLCCSTIRKTLVSSASAIHLVQKVEQLPIPTLIKEYILLGQLI